MDEDEVEVDGVRVRGCNDLHKQVREWARCPEEYPVKIESWDVSNIVDMSGLFKDVIVTDELNRQVAGIIYGWDVSKVVNMTSMFEGCTAFNLDLTGYCTKQKKEWIESGDDGSGSGGKLNYDIGCGCCRDNAWTTNYGWSFQNVQKMDHMFEGCVQMNSLYFLPIYVQQLTDIEYRAYKLSEEHFGERTFHPRRCNGFLEWKKSVI